MLEGLTRRRPGLAAGGEGALAGKNCGWISSVQGPVLNLFPQDHDQIVTYSLATARVAGDAVLLLAAGAGHFLVPAQGDRPPVGQEASCSLPLLERRVALQKTETPIDALQFFPHLSVPLDAPTGLYSN